MLWEIRLDKEKGRRTTLAEEMEFLGADGVDFVPFDFNPSCTPQSQIYCSLTKEQVINGAGYPRTPHLFWKDTYGLKMYFVPTNESIEKI